MSYAAILFSEDDVPRTVGPFRLKKEASDWMKDNGWWPPSVADGERPGMWGSNGYPGYLVKLEAPKET